MAGSKDDILEYLQAYKDRKEETDIELVKIESRLEERRSACQKEHRDLRITHHLV
jgi:hypothetical protein